MSDHSRILKIKKGNRLDGARRPLVLVLAISLLIETALTMVGFLDPYLLLSQFGLGAAADTLFLVHVLCWTLAFISIVCALALKWVIVENPQGWTWSFILGFWWMAIGIGIYLFRGTTDNLVIDSLKGLLIVAFAWRSRPEIVG